ncbi:MAG: carboxylesterase family protein [Thiohalocapsa sp.]|uniref:carboxylesterase/lipase family protein n=1 Tax=Thiohalocapsa sp. TaxID=2497641 RepID=UPI0025EC8E90|nr:carboxylesterase/lipase family protein [Thiohalocapsa sp.]MCG6943338.1 carboxylesterase family protein [Thiohalocapsa sp.]
MLIACAMAAASADQVASPPANSAPIQRPACTAPTVETADGPVCGAASMVRAADGSGVRPVDAYLGIPYAETTAGEHRWRPPIPAAVHAGVLNATAFGPACPQVDLSAQKASQSEECLSLNIWTPRREHDDGTTSLPVMVFIHGGSFVAQSSALPLYDGRHLAASGRVVFVSINYRLGALGFLAGIHGLSGNYGFLDQQRALQWLHDNIARFGGDPDQVTLVGQSAGAMSVGLHLESAGSRPLFRAAIMESNPYGIPYKTLEVARPFGEGFALESGCLDDVLDCLRGKSVEDILSAQSSILVKVASMLAGFAGELAWAPVIDGDVIPGQPVTAMAEKPLLLGTNANEGVLFASGEQLDWLGKVEVPEVLYGGLVELLFPPRARAEIRELARYRPVGGDDTAAMAHLVTDYLFRCPNRLVSLVAAAPVYAYEFTHAPSFNVWPRVPLCAPKTGNVCHAAEQPFVFGNPMPVLRQAEPTGDRFTPAERVLSERVAGYWISFAEALNPNYAGAPAWPAFTEEARSWQILNTSITSEQSLHANCPFWDSVGYDIPGVFTRIVDGLKR